MAKVSASILSSDYLNFKQTIADLEKYKADYIHFDIMDGHFVPNITFGPMLIKNLRPHSKLQFDVHLMITDVDKYIEEFARAGADIITVHVEAVVHLDCTLSKIKSLGKKAGISLVPSTSPETIKYILDKLDLILIMTVNPGFGGQEFLESQLSKIEEVSKIIKGKNIELSVDGGINENTARKCIEKGANVLVSGSYLFEDLEKRINSLHNVSS